VHARRGQCAGQAQAATGAGLAGRSHAEPDGVAETAAAGTAERDHRSLYGAMVEVLGLTGQGNLERVEASGHSLLIVKRKGCCLDYLITPDRLCATCPKQDNALRIARQAANALAELG